LSALERISAKFHWDIVGAGPCEEFLRNQVSRSRISDCTSFHGSVGHQKLHSLFRKCAFFALTSIEVVDQHGLDAEGFGLVYLEAAAHKRPSIASSTGGCSEAIHHGVTGFVVDPYNESQMVSALELLLKSTALREFMGRAAFQMVQGKFSLLDRAMMLTRHYEAVANHRTTQ
jgi:phosphatidylinositol alpha-1,6-mannosyltransferase